MIKDNCSKKWLENIKTNKHHQHHPTQQQSVTLLKITNSQSSLQVEVKK